MKKSERIALLSDRLLWETDIHRELRVRTRGSRLRLTPKSFGVMEPEVIDEDFSGRQKLSDIHHFLDTPINYSTALWSDHKELKPDLISLIRFSLITDRKELRSFNTQKFSNIYKFQFIRILGDIEDKFVLHFGMDRKTKEWVATQSYDSTFGARIGGAVHLDRNVLCHFVSMYGVQDRSKHQWFVEFLPKNSAIKGLKVPTTPTGVMEFFVCRSMSSIRELKRFTKDWITKHYKVLDGDSAELEDEGIAEFLSREGMEFVWSDLKCLVTPPVVPLWGRDLNKVR